MKKVLLVFILINSMLAAGCKKTECCEEEKNCCKKEKKCHNECEEVNCLIPPTKECSPHAQCGKEVRFVAFCDHCRCQQQFHPIFVRLANECEFPCDPTLTIRFKCCLCDHIQGLDPRCQTNLTLDVDDFRHCGCNHCRSRELTHSERSLWGF